MGKTPKPLRILLHPEIAGWGEWEALRGQGHVVHDPSAREVGPPDSYDLILGPTCWQMTHAHRKYLPLAIAAARAVRWPKERRDEAPIS